jgi:hypothetical protein
MYLLSAIEQCEVESPPPEISGHIDRMKEMVPCPFSIPDSKKTSYSRRIWFLSRCGPLGCVKETERKIMSSFAPRFPNIYIFTTSKSLSQ